MSAPRSHRRKGGRMTRLQKASAMTGVAAVGVTAVAFGVTSGGSGGEVQTAGSDTQARPVAWQAAVDAPSAQKNSVDDQTSQADSEAKAAAEARLKARMQAEAKRKVAERAEAKRKAEAARKAAAEKRQRAEQAAREKAQQRKERQQAASRSANRQATPSGSPQQIAKQIIGDDEQFQCFSNIVERESGWDVHAQNPSGAYGLVQALPGSKMSSAGPDWRNNAATQVKWGLDYMKDRYGSACGAWSFWQANNWY